jgi:putative ABC transport system permease protein
MQRTRDEGLGPTYMNTLVQDVRYAIRMLAHNPAFTLAAVLSLALGIGANTAIFSIVDNLLWRPLPVAEPDRLVAIYASDEEGSFGTSCYPDYIDYRNQNEVFSDILAYSSFAAHLSAEGQTQRVRGAVVTGNYFSLLGVGAEAGRTLQAEDDVTPDAHPVADIIYGLWQKAFANDIAIAGKIANINGHKFTIIGVADRNFKGLEIDSQPDVWVPMAMQKQALPQWDFLMKRDARWLSMIGRLKPKVTIEQAQANMNTIARQLEEAYKESNQGYNVARLLPANNARIWPDDRDSLVFYMWLLITVVGTVLLIACANVANILLARASSRRREISIRLAMGANRMRIIRQMLTESILLAFVGGATGLLAAGWLIDLMSAFKLPTTYPLPVESLHPTLDGRVLLFTLGASAVTSILFGLVPALHASKPDLLHSLKDESGAVGFSRHRSRLRNTLVISQIALSIILLIAASLFTRTLLNKQAIDPGFNTENALLMSVDLGLQGYNRERGLAFFNELSQKVNAVPGVKASALAMVVPINPGGMRSTATVEGYVPQKGEDMNINQNIVTPTYFETMGIPILRGRGFSEQDTGESQKVLIINETLANRLWPGLDPVGRRMSFGDPDEAGWSIVIGVARDSKYRGLRENPRPYVYIPLAQEYMPSLAMIVRTESDPQSLTSTLRGQVQSLDGQLPIYNVKTLEEHLGVLLSQDKMAATLMTTFGMLAMVLAILGIYGVMSYSVSQRTREIGLRMALGAEPRSILRHFVGQGLLLTLTGTGVGIVAAYYLMQYLSSLLYGVSATDPLTFAAIAVLLTLVALVACYIPARRATKVDPMIALRYE